ncbi:MAG TPA: hypothetical protein VMF61_03975 [Candidatus Acidoferrales bacterium]|nr:hypothetical protein [Candidatus Acidoferrales bacterium]
MKSFSFAPLGIIALAAILVAMSLTSAAVGGAFAVTACKSPNPCVGGNNTGASSGVRGTAVNSYGVVGVSEKGKAGVYGLSTSQAGVQGKSTSGSGVVGGSNTGNGVWGTSVNLTGLFGESTNGNALVAQALGGGTGVEASSATGYGIYASAGGDDDVILANAGSSNTAVDASASTGYAIKAVNNTGSSIPAAYMNNAGGNGVDSEGSYIGVVARAPASGGYPLVATDQSGNNLFYVDGSGNVAYHGELSHFAVTPRGRSIRTFTTTNESPTIETTGSGMLVNGVAAIAFDPAFADSIGGARYHVLLTPDGDTRGLFVARKDSGGFVVREVQGGRGSFAFDYHVYATDASVAAATAPRTPRAPLTHAGRPKPPEVPRP